MVVATKVYSPVDIDVRQPTSLSLPRALPRIATHPPDGRRLLNGSGAPRRLRAIIVAFVALAGSERILGAFSEQQDAPSGHFELATSRARKGGRAYCRNLYLPA